MRLRPWVLLPIRWCVPIFKGMTSRDFPVAIRQLTARFRSAVALLGVLLMAAIASPSASAQISDARCEDRRAVVVGLEPVAHLAPPLEESLRTQYAGVAEYVGATDCDPILVTLTSDLKAAEHTLPRWHLPPWAAGAARPEARTILLTVHANGQPTDRARVLRHELAHLAIASASGGNKLPRWFDEGISRTVAREDGPTDAEVLNQARAFNNLFNLDELRHAFPADKNQAAIAYAESARAIAYLERTHGGDIVARLLARVKAGEAFDDALLRLTGETPGTITQAVKDELRPLVAFLAAFWQVDLGLAFGGGFFFWAGLRARRRIRERIEAMDDEPLPEDVFLNAQDLVVARWTT